ncbi:MAG: phosphoenolpyruvate--protein phosphotransferase [Calditrichaeota bacterium]|nr:MAG: phosphoenolpyruvate--protein phosphotransferase [Calditrichota bacterium]MBL1206427.1 phosphoenolpyruvate--protein phosphotransferase [Calditrichota bacterium]NOG46253.1 phosphoenolpyruvate--protein phosphotransferase [Calditrichota bacterium]
MKNKESTKQIIIRGLATAPGIAVGPAYIFKPFAINMAELDTVAASAKAECEHFKEARSKVLDQLNFASKQSFESYGDEFSEIFNSQIAFLNDTLLLEEIRTKIYESNQSAAYAVTTVLSQKSNHFINLENRYFRERAFDIIDLKQKLILALFGIKIDYQLTTPSIIISENLSPTDTVNFNRNLILGFLTDQGGQTSHSAILARGLKIPSVVNGKNLSKVIRNGDEIILDGFKGTIIINPESETRGKYLELKEKHNQQQAILVADNTKKAITKDNVEISLLANIELPHEVTEVSEFNAQGVGLYRTEALFMENNSTPSEDEQFKAYKKIVKSLGSDLFVIRTIDLGGDKLIEGLTTKSELNPFLGWRAIRFCLDNPQIFKPQLRAILRASAYGNIRILLPMVSSISEILQVKELINEARHELQTSGYKISPNVDLGVMIETPSAAIMASTVGKYVDFLSIGSNDLTQYTLAVDRTNSKVAHSYSSFDPAVIRLMQMATIAGIENNIPVSICGEFASVPSAVPVLLGMGLRSLSVTPHFIPRIKKIIRSVHINSCIKLYDKIQTLHLASEIEEVCNDFIQTNVPELSFSKEDI